MVVTSGISSTPLPPPIISPYGTLEGSIFQYHQNLVAFESTIPPSPSPPPLLLSKPQPQQQPPLPSKKKCILVGGLSDGLLPTPYTESLQNACKSSSSFFFPALSLIMYQHDFLSFFLLLTTAVCFFFLSLFLSFWHTQNKTKNNKFIKVTNWDGVWFNQ